MDIKITKGRFANLVNYDLIKTLLSIVAAVMVWVLLFTTCATRATIGEQFSFLIFGNISYKDAFVADMLTELKEEKELSYDVLNLSTGNVTAAGNYSALYMLSLKASTKEGDVLLFNGKKVVATNDDGSEKTDESGNKIKTVNSDAQSIVNSGYIVDFKQYLNEAEKYLAKFVVNGEVDEKSVENYFLNTRMKQASNYRKTFRTPEQKAEGVKLEIERIETLKKNYEIITRFLKEIDDMGEDVFWYADFNKGESYEKTNVAYGIDLDKVNAVYSSRSSKVRKLSDYLWYYEKIKADDSDEETLQNSSEGLVLSVFDYGADQYDLQFESLAVINNMIRMFSEDVQ